MKYCVECVYPHTKPDLVINSEGVCSACTAFRAREEIDWAKREQEFKSLVYATKQMKFPYDCIVPVSGGKDSTYQVVKAKEYGLKVLAVTATTDHLSKLGRANLDNISNLGVDHIEVTPNKALRRKLSKYSLIEVGDCSWPEHCSIFSIPIHIAQKFHVPMVLYGENPQAEYGGPYDAQRARLLTERWFTEFGGMLGLRARDFIDQGYGTETDMQFYSWPKRLDGNLNNPSVSFLGYFLPWDGYTNACIAAENGFKWFDRPVEGIGYSYENIDNLQTGARDYLRYVKYGYGRATDLVCNHIRRKRMTRAEGISHLEIWDGQWPGTYLGVSLEEILKNIDVTLEEFIKVVNQFTNKDLFDLKYKEPVNFGNDIKPKFEIGKNA